MKSRYCWASASTEILARSTFWVRASASKRSSGPSKPSTSTTSVSPKAARRSPSACSQSEKSPRSSGASPMESSVAFIPSRRLFNSRDASASAGSLAHQHERLIGIEGLRLAKLGDGVSKPLAAVAFKRRHDAGDLAHLVERTATVKRHVAAGIDDGGGTLGHRAAERLHADIIAHHQARQSDQLTNHFAHYNGRHARRSLIIESGEQNMGGHGERRVAQCHEGPKIDRDQLLGRGIDARQHQMAVGPRPAVPRNVLDHRQHASGKGPLDHGAAEVADDVRIEAEGAVADDVMGAGFRNIEHWRAIDVDARLAELLGNQPRPGKSRGPSAFGVIQIEVAIEPRRRHLAPMWRSQALHAS